MLAVTSSMSTDSVTSRQRRSGASPRRPERPSDVGRQLGVAQLVGAEVDRDVGRTAARRRRPDGRLPAGLEQDVLPEQRR